MMTRAEKRTRKKKNKYKKHQISFFLLRKKFS